MPLTLIKGHYRIVGASPDGDSVRFYPDDPHAFAAAGIQARVNSRGGAQLRLDGIDALETHYRPPASHKMWRQPADLGDDAASALLGNLGFTSVVRGPDGTVTSSTPEEAPGYVLTRFADKYGRVVSFAYRGSRRVRADNRVWLDVTTLKSSANYQLVADGRAYPTFYSKLYPDLREAMASAAVAARRSGEGVWGRDGTLPGFTLRSRDQLENELVILPKLFRRLAEYLGLDNTGEVSLAQFRAFLAAHDDRLFTVPDGHATSFDTLVDVKRQTVTLTVPPERIVFLEA
jgi:endonuclease YncB( thermonuclease family)